MVQRSLKSVKRKDGANYGEFYFNRVGDSFKKIIEDSKSKIADNDEEDSAFKSLESPTKEKILLLKRLKLF